ncbi:GerMN domain-containing protein [Tuberibacillus sp. Marseille-P3662]|uniref:GerMN domain-containing protein n=1 Tax=Tuberibacillus sp. Marseille-P3662 TaxID=1965358 RepID=UPI000A1CB6A9|nr:GerMN domain-containing protein [Tuberibacillus sp. Marseille-P3662]
MRFKNKSWLAALVLICSVVLSGCVFQDEDAGNIKPKPDVDVVKKDDKNQATSDSSAKKEDTATAKRQLYLVDKNGHVSPQIVQLPVPESNTVAEQVVKNLVIDGPVSNKVPDGFRATLPAGTQVNGINIKEDGTAVVDLSSEFKNYKAENEDKILQSMAWSLTQFDSIDKVKLRVDGVALKTAPRNKTPIADGITRADGINTQLGNVTDVTNSDSVTVYYMAQNKDDFYYVPVTQRVQMDESTSEAAAAVKAMTNGPVGTKGLLSPFGDRVELASKPVVKDGVLTLNFNSEFYTDPKTKTVSGQAVDTLALSLIKNESNVKKLSIKVEGSQKVTTESGQKLTEPVTVPSVNKMGV